MPDFTFFLCAALKLHKWFSFPGFAGYIRTTVIFDTKT